MGQDFALLSYRLPRRDSVELIDTPDVAAAELAENLDDLSRINQLFGGVALSAWALKQFVQNAQIADQLAETTLVHSVAPLTVLDIGSGLADIPRALVAQARRRGTPLRVIATDVNPQIMRFAQKSGDGAVAHQSGGVNGSQPSALYYAAADGMRLPFADGSIEIAACSLTLHHFAPEQAVELLREMRRVARRGLIVNDIVRSWPGLAGAWLFGHLFSQNRLTRHDGLASVQRAYTPAELRELATDAGLHVVAIRGVAGYRVAMVCV